MGPHHLWDACVSTPSNPVILLGTRPTHSHAQGKCQDRCVGTVTEARLVTAKKTQTNLEAYPKGMAK
jgi:hypothetical protein